jgi:hypothetical protein
MMRAWAERDGVRVGFGELRTKVLPSPYRHFRAK